jgi:ornithine cyclodeaminase
MMVPLLDTQSVNRLIDIPNLIDALRAGYKRGAHIAPRQHHVVREAPPAALLTMAAWAEGCARVVKIMSANPGNTTRGMPTSEELLAIFDGDTGLLRAIVASAALTNLRTAATSALAATCLAPPDAEVLLLVGTGALAPYMARAHATARSYKRLIVAGREFGKAEHLAIELAATLPCLPISATTDIEAAARSADVITVATRSTTPIVKGSWLKANGHLDLVGAYTETMREADSDAVCGADVWVAATAALEGHLPGDFAAPIAEGSFSLDRIKGEITDLLRNPPRCRTRRTLFKSVGYALEDLYAADFLLRQLTDRP